MLLLLPLFNEEAIAEAVLDKLTPATKESTQSHFQQDVFHSLRTIPGLYATYNCFEHGLEKDIVVHSYGGKLLEAPIAVEVNGVFHYCRNSELPIGKDLLKAKWLKTKGYRALVVPYFDWSILENAQKANYLEDLI